MHRAAEVVLDHGLEQVPDTHRRPTRGENEVGGLEPAPERGDVRVDAVRMVRECQRWAVVGGQGKASLVGHDPEIDDFVAVSLQRSFQGRPVSVPDTAPAIPGKRGRRLHIQQLVPGAEERNDGLPECTDLPTPIRSVDGWD